MGPKARPRTTDSIISTLQSTAQHRASAVRRRRSVAFVASAALLGALAPAANSAGLTATDPARFKASAISPASRIEGSKSQTGRVAQSDTALLARTDAAMVDVMVKLDYDAAASYQGGVAGLAPTSPKTTGSPLTGRSTAEVSYDRYAASVEARFTDGLAKAVPTARTGVRLRAVYGGIAVRLPANQAKSLLALPGVAAVHSDAPQQPDEATVEAAEFMGSAGLWRYLGGQANAGKGVILADLDTGVWPEHPFFADNPALGDPPAAPSGLPRACDFGDNPLTAAADEFVCNRKLIGGRPFQDTHNANIPGDLYSDSARDADGHGTHTTSTAAGNVLTSAPIFGVDRGPISGVAPGAWILAYKVCGSGGCYPSDSAAAIQQAILDGANVINFSISGGNDPFTDPVELAFLDAYNAGILVSASAGNAGPGAGTTNHRSPWTLTVAASTQTREFASTLTVTGADGASATFSGATVTAGVPTNTPIVKAEDIPGYDALCSTELAAGAADGKLVACKRGVVGRVQKGFNVKAGGAVGMILYNQPLQDVETDNHFLPTVHLADGTEFLAFLAAHSGATGSFPPGEKRNGQGDVMASFSSRGPGGQFLKPDITAPGVQVLAGHTPTPVEIPSGPAGEYFQAIAGTSMSAPNAAGAALLLKAAHPRWSPAAIKSALMTTAVTSVVKEDLLTPADPFDMGAGRVDLTDAGLARVVFEETTERMVSVGSDPLAAANLNLPSINLPTMPGAMLVKRTLTNVSRHWFSYRASTVAPADSRITVWPSSGSIAPGASKSIWVRVSSTAAEGQYFGSVTLKARSGPDVRLPVAFYNRQGAVTLTQTCDPTTIAKGETASCTVTMQNNAVGPATVRGASWVSNGLKIVGAQGATIKDGGRSAYAAPATLAAPKDAIPAIAAGTTPGDGYLDLALFGIAPVAVGDEESVNYTVPGFVFGGVSYNQIGVTSNGYLIIGGSQDAGDVLFTPQNLPDPTRPNGVLAPYWTDLDGTGAPGLRVATLTDGVSTWLVVQWEVHLWGDTSAAGMRRMQVWIGVNGVQDISYGYHPSAMAPAADALTVGVENVTGTAGAQIEPPPTGSLVVTSTPGEPGGSASYTLTVQGVGQGSESVNTWSLSDQVAGYTRVGTRIQVDPAG